MTVVLVVAVVGAGAAFSTWALAARVLNEFEPGTAPRWVQVVSWPAEQTLAAVQRGRCR